MDKSKKLKKVKTEYKTDVANHGNVKFVKIMHEPLTRALFQNLTSDQVSKIVKNNTVNCDDIYSMFTTNDNFDVAKPFTCACGRKRCTQWNEIINVEDASIVIEIGSSCIKRFDWGEKYLKFINENQKKEKKDLRDEIKRKDNLDKMAKQELLRKQMEITELHTIKVPFGRHQGMKLVDLFYEDHQYLKWLNTITTTPKFKSFLEKLLSEELSPDLV